ncbi:MAG: DNA methyltransferase [Kofleriaceae bacterium]
MDCLLDTALDPVVDAAVKGQRRQEAEAALLALKVVDPACGSGHFLVAAARRMARRLATVRTGDDEPSPPELRHALRDVIGRCVYGVDLNEMAVELCKVALWMEAIEPGRPLSFLDAHIQHGNALLGATPALIARGVPDDAWSVLEGDDKEVAKALKKRNRDERKAAEKQQGTMFAASAGERIGKLAAAAREALAGDDDNVEDVRAREDRWARFQSSRDYKDARLVASTWCAAFLWQKAADDQALAAAAPTYATFASLRADPSTASGRLVKEVRERDNQYLFFHWHLQFPDAFGVVSAGAAFAEDDVTGWTGGFDVVLGNPPWERVKLQEKEFFAGRSDAIAKAENAAVRKRLIAKLPEDDPPLWNAWCDALRTAQGESQWMRASGRYPLCGQGDINTYSIFAELNRSLMSERGRVGCIVPGGIATDDTTKEFFGALVTTRQLSSLYHFENEEHVFSAVHNAFRFCLLTLAAGRPKDAQTDMVFFARQVAYLADEARHVRLSADDFLALNPNTRTCPTFRWRRDAEINKAIYRRVPVLWREEAEDGNPWGIRFLRMLDMSTDSGLFLDRAACERDGFALHGNVFTRGGAKRLPLYEAKMVHHFDHRFGTYEGQTEAQSNKGFLPQFTDGDHADPSKLPLPYYWVDDSEVSKQLAGRWSRDWFIGWRDICRSSDLRTAIASAVPRHGFGDTFLLALPGDAVASMSAVLLGNLASLIFDYCARQKVGGTHLKYNVMRQLPVVTPAHTKAFAPWDLSTPIEEWISKGVLELAYTSYDLSGFAMDVGYAGPPFRWDPERRAILRAELDAAFFHLYGLDADDTAYILDTFPVLRDKEVRQFGEYRTRRLVLERYAALATAISTRTPYTSPLDPPPASPLAAHPERQ